PAELHLLPTLWYRNTWAWGGPEAAHRPSLRRAADAQADAAAIVAEHVELGRYRLSCEGAPDLLFAENDTNFARLWGSGNPTPYVKDAFHEAIVHGRPEAVNPAGVGTKAAAHYRLTIAAGATETIRLRLRQEDLISPVPRVVAEQPEQDDL